MTASSFSQLIIVTVMIVLLGCDKDEMNVKEPCILDESHNFTDSSFHIGIPGQMEFGFATAKKLGRDWVASAMSFDQDTALGFVFVTEPDLPVSRLRELVTFEEISKEEGCYELTADIDLPGFLWYSLSDFDVSVGKYMLLQEDQIVNSLEISRLTEDSVFGKFSVSVIDTGSIQWLEQPDYVRFYNGEFEAILMK